MAIEVIRGQKNTPAARLPKSEAPSWISNTLKQAATGLAGSVGDLGQAINTLGADVGEYITGIKASPIKPLAPTSKQLRVKGQRLQFLVHNIVLFHHAEEVARLIVGYQVHIDDAWQLIG